MSKHLLVWSLAWLGLLASAGCGNSSGSGPSCNVTSAGVCTDFGSGYPAASAQQYCTANSGTYSESGACPTANRIGSCEVSGSGLSMTQRYYSPNFDATSGPTTCSGSGGTYTAG